VSPNPNEAGVFQVRLGESFDADAQLKLSDVLGRVFS
jgi:hypothetical protein